MTRCSILFLSLLVFQLASGQTLIYQVYKGSELIGQTSIAKQSDGVNTYLTSQSYSEFSVFFKDYRMDTETFSNYRNMELVDCMDHQELNGALRSHSEIVYTGDGYQVKTHTEEFTQSIAPVNWTFMRLYHEEPIGVTEVFSERLGKYCPLTKVADHRYKADLPDGRDNYYSYVDGICVESEVRTWVATIYLKLID